MNINRQFWRRATCGGRSQQILFKGFRMSAQGDMRAVPYNYSLMSQSVCFKLHDKQYDNRCCPLLISGAKKWQHEMFLHYEIIESY